MGLLKSIIKCKRSPSLLDLEDEGEELKELNITTPKNIKVKDKKIKIFFINPHYCNVYNIEEIFVKGEGFKEDCMIIIGGIDCKTVFHNRELISCFTPDFKANEGFKSIKVKNPDGESFIFEHAVLFTTLE